MIRDCMMTVFRKYDNPFGRRDVIDTEVYRFDYVNLVDVTRSEVASLISWAMNDPFGITVDTIRVERGLHNVLFVDFEITEYGRKQKYAAVISPVDGKPFPKVIK